MGLHSLTGSRYVIDILNKLGHIMPYKLTCEIETSQAEIEEKLLDGEGTILPIVSNDESSSVLTVFRLDNFDTVVEQVEGEGSVNTNHMMAFQEMTPETKTNDNKVQIQSTKKRQFVGSEFKSTHANINPTIKKKSFISRIKWEGFKDMKMQSKFENINSAFFCLTIRYSAFISTLKGTATDLRHFARN